MEQELTYRGVRYVIGSETGDARAWAIYPENGPTDGAAGGLSRPEGARGSFKAAVMAARLAIDDWLVSAAGDVLDPDCDLRHSPNPQ